MLPTDVANPDAIEPGPRDRDLGPLAWVLDEIRKSLDGAVKALRRYVHDAEVARDSDIAALDVGALRVARQQLHQAGGALEMAGMAPPALVLRAMENAVQRFVQHPQLCSDEAAAAIERASFALTEYLEIVLAGKMVSAVTLFPQYRDVQVLAGAERVHPADLWPAEHRFRDPDIALSAPTAAYGPTTRETLDGAVLRIVRDSDFDAAHDLRDLCLGLAAAQSDRQVRAFWKVSAAFYDAFARGMFATDVYAKRAASRVLIQYVGLARGDVNISQRLVQELLFFCAQARVPEGESAPLLSAVRDTFGLDRFEPVDYEARRFGRFDPAVLAKARKRISAAAEVWSSLAGGDRNKIKSAVDQFGLVFDSLRKLNNHSDSLAQALSRAVEQTALSGEPPSAFLSMEVATSVLYLQAALAEPDIEEELMIQRAGVLAHRLDEVCSGREPAPLESWMEELYRRVSDHQTMGSVVQELRASLSEAEQAMDLFFRSPDDSSSLLQVPERLSQMRGVLSVLGLDHASQAVLRTRDAVEKLLHGEPADPAARHRLFEKLGNNLGALGFMFDMLGYQSAMARKLFIYDEDAEELRVIPGRATPQAEDAATSVASDAAADRDVHQQQKDSLAEAPAAPVPPTAHISADPPTSSDKSATPLVSAVSHDSHDKSPVAFAAQDAPAEAPVPTLPLPAAVEDVTPQVHVREPEVDAELLDIFLEEAREVVVTGLAAVVALRTAPADLGEQTTLRRAFHTLKGSSRMVGLNEFGEAAWSMEQLLNVWLAEQKPIEQALLETADQALRGFGRWADDISGGNDSEWSATAFTRVAEAMRLEGNVLPLVLPLEKSADVGIPPVSRDGSEPDIKVTREADAVVHSHDALEVDDNVDSAAAFFDEAEASAGIDLAAEEDGAAADTQPMSAEFWRLHQGDPPPAERDAGDSDSAPLEFSETAPLDLEDFFREFNDKSESPTAAPVPEPEHDDIDFSAFQLLDADAGTTGADEATRPEPHAASFLKDPAVSLETSTSVHDLIDKPSEDLASSEYVEASDGQEEPELWVAHDGAELPGGSTEEIFDAISDTEEISDAVPEPMSEPVTQSVPDEAPEESPEELPAAVQDDLPSGAAYEDDLDSDYAPDSAFIKEALAATTDEDNVKVIGHLRIGHPLYNVYLNEADEWSRRLCTALQEWSLELAEPLPDVAIALAHSLAGSSATVGFDALSQTARLLEHALAHAQLQAGGDAGQAKSLLNAAEEIRRLLHQFAAGFLKTADAEVEQELRYILASEISTTLSPALDEASEQGEAASPHAEEKQDDAEHAASEEQLAPLSEHAAKAPAHEPPQSRGEVAPALSVVRADVEPASDYAALDDHAFHAPIDDDIDAIDVIDADLFPIFEEEAAELLPQLGGALRQWTAHPDNTSSRNEVLRALHTLKGSSRLAGAMRLGEMAHRMESAVEELGTEDLSEAKIEPLLGDLDSLESSFQTLRDPDAEMQKPVGVAPAQHHRVTHRKMAQPNFKRNSVLDRPFDLAKPLSVKSISNQSVRVRALLLDRMVNQAGEVMITRARMESRLAQLTASMSDLTMNLARLRTQLRDIEVQSESQMQSRLALSKDTAAGFDPLEFDRFTRVQELTRMMAESVNDVATVQRNLQQVVQGTEDDLIAQGRQAKELQRDLLRTRMVEFEGIAERLYAVVRQSSKEAGKQIKLDITGGTIEMDRGVIDRMTPAFEHLLRNCVAHGIEAPEQRLAAGKDATGTINVALRHDGNDVSVEFRDDGAGLNLQRIHARAVELKLVDAESVLTDEEAVALVFSPGFTTASEVTELSGRGIGMDVVRAEVLALGGRIETSTVAGAGTAFRMVLPLTTAVTQVVMLRAGSFSFGVPSPVIEQVRRFSASEIAAAYSSGSIDVSGEQVPFFWAGALLQASSRSQEAIGKTRFVVILSSASQRVAIHVDDVLGNQEVVVKNLGPQLARLPGLAGMSALASGAVVLIYNPVALAAVYGDEVQQAIERAKTDKPQGDMESGATVPKFAAAEQLPLVLVVDDSITVRRVTQRLLLREGYRVVLAADGLQALERLQEERPTVVLSDIEMPRMDGFDLARNIRADAQLHGLPIVMITSRIAQKHRDLAEQLGVDHYLGKPYSDDELLALVRHYVQAAAGREVTA